MIDIETLGKNPGCIILSIGAVRFGEDDVKGEWFYRRISTLDCINNGLVSDFSTIDWWFSQDAAVRDEAFGGTDKLEAVLRDLSAWIGTESEVWGNGAAFDLGILRAAFIKFGINDPWRYTGERCFRTLSAFSGGSSRIPLTLVNPPSGFNKAVAHNALWDAAVQARSAIEMIEVIEMLMRFKRVVKWLDFTCKAFRKFFS